MLRAPTVAGARRKMRGICNGRDVEKKAVSIAKQRGDDVADQGPSDLPEPPAKKTRYGRRPASPRPEEKPNKPSSSKKPKHDVPRRDKARFIYNSKYKNYNKHVVNDGAGSSKDGAAEISEDAGVSESVAETNNEVSAKAGGSGKRCRKHKKHTHKVDQDGMLTKKVRKEKADSVVDSLTDLLDVMSVEETRKKPTATASSKKNVFDPEQVVKHTKMKWEADCRKAATASALRSTVVVEGIPRPVLQHIDSSIKEFFGSCGQVIHYSTHEFLQEGNFAFSATVHFGSEDAASRALAMNGSCFGGVAVRVRCAGPLEWTLRGPEGRAGMTTSRVSGTQPIGIIRPRLGLPLGVQHFYYPGAARVEASLYVPRFVRAEVSSDSD